MANLKEKSKDRELFSAGHRACTGCGIKIYHNRSSIIKKEREG